MATILIYDPGDEDRQAIRETLQIRPEWNLIDAATGQDARKHLDSEPIDLIVVGAPLSELNGDVLVERLRSHHAQVPVVVLTGDGESSQASVEALLLGASSYVPRSAIARDLIVTVERILTLAGCRRRDARLLDALDATESRFTLVDNDLEMVSVLVRHLADLSDEFAICGNGARMRLAVALEEAMINGIVHGNLEVPSALRDDGDRRYQELIRQRRTQSPYCHRTLSVRSVFTSGEARFTIRDQGPGFDPRHVPDPTRFENLSKPHGRGLFLIRAFMDEVTFNSQGNEIRLVKRTVCSRKTS